MPLLFNAHARRRRPPITVAWLLAAAALSGCAGARHPEAATHESFDSSATYSRPYVATQEESCEAARRALLSQGYLIATANKDFVNGRKSFQPQPESHVELDLRIVCVIDGERGGGATVYVSAVQDRYALKKSSTSASVGVGVLGSVSVPFSQSDDSLVKVASETVAEPQFYERFFALIDKYLEKPVAP